MKLLHICENVFDKLTAMLYNRLKAVLGDDFSNNFPDYVLEQQHYITSGSRGDPSNAWFAKLSHREHPRLSVNIGVKHGISGIVISNKGQHSTWSSVKTALLEYIDHTNNKIMKNKILDAKTKKDSFEVIEILDHLYQGDDRNEEAAEIDTTNRQREFPNHHSRYWQTQIGKYTLQKEVAEESLQYDRFWITPAYTYSIQRDVQVSEYGKIPIWFSVRLATKVPLGSRGDPSNILYGIGSQQHNLNKGRKPTSKFLNDLKDFKTANQLLWPEAGGAYALGPSPFLDLQNQVGSRGEGGRQEFRALGGCALDVYRKSTCGGPGHEDTQHEGTINNNFKYYIWQAIYTLLTGSTPEDIADDVERNVDIFEKIHQYCEQPKIYASQGCKWIRGNYSNGHIIGHCDLLIASDYGQLTVRIQHEAKQAPDKLTVTLTLPHMNPSPRADNYDIKGLNRSSASPSTEISIQELEESLNRNDLKDFLNSLADEVISKEVEESLNRNNFKDDESLIVENDFIDDDIVEMAKDILKPILDEFPEVTIKRGSKNNGKYNKYDLLVLTRPAKPGEKPNANTLIIARGGANMTGDDELDGGLLLGRPGGQYKRIQTEDELTAGVMAWIKPIKPARRPRSIRNIQPPIGWDVIETDHEVPALVSGPDSKSDELSYDIDKSEYFPRSIQHRNKRIPGKTISKGDPFTLAIHVKNTDIPQEIFSALNLHHVGGRAERFIGWIGGTINHQEKAMYINEVQSDLMQRTIEMTNQERFNEKIAKSIVDTKSDLMQARRELATLKRSYGTITNKFRLIELIQDKTKEVEDLLKKSNHIYKLSDYSNYKSKVENSFKKWILAFYHSAFNRARQLNLSDIYIISSDKIISLWGQIRNKDNIDGNSLYVRAYDSVAKQIGATLVDQPTSDMEQDIADGKWTANDWWHIRLNDIPFSESVRRPQVSGNKYSNMADLDIALDLIPYWVKNSKMTINHPDALR